jgi:hypothetical protein
MKQLLNNGKTKLILRLLRGRYQEWGEGWRDDFQLPYIIRTFVNVTLYPQYNNNKNKFKKTLKSASASETSFK